MSSKGLIAHAQDPFALWQALGAAGRQPQLLEGRGDHPEAKRSIVVCDPVRTIQLRPDGVVCDGHFEPGDPLALFQHHLDETSGAGWFPMWVGTFHFEMAHVIETDLPRPTEWPNVPLGEWSLYAAGAVWDDQHVVLHGISDEMLAETGPAAVEAQPSGKGPTDEQQPGTDSWSTSLDAADFVASVQQIKHLIVAGDHFQTNLATRFRRPVSSRETPALWYQRLRDGNPSPYMALLRLQDRTIVSGSPEQLFATEAACIRARPIAGTRSRGQGREEDDLLEQELLSDPKEQAEHTMLVDLVRNDIAQVATPGTVYVPERMSVERYRHVMHLVSRVEARLRPSATFTDCVRALFPGGTITGAPKHRAMQRIMQAEPVQRGAYTGSAGFIAANGTAALNILIRTLTWWPPASAGAPAGASLGCGPEAQTAWAEVHAGSGIVAESDPQAEWVEANRKAEALLQAATTGIAGGNATRLGSVEPHGSWRPSAFPTEIGRGKRVLLIDNYDSFVHNLADYCAALGAEVKVLRNTKPWRSDAAWATHIILSPGPGHPRDSGASVEIASEWPGPLLGVCLGHQAMALASGATIEAVVPMHGRSDLVTQAGTPQVAALGQVSLAANRAGHVHEAVGQLAGETASLLAALPQTFVAARYHSLVVKKETLPEAWVPVAWTRSEDRLLMAMRHCERPHWGLQFHPESIATPQGLQVMAAFLGL